MTIRHYDPASGAGAGDGTTWADAFTTIELAYTGSVAGDIIYFRQGTTDALTGTRTMTPPGIISNPVKVIGVKSGTVNEGVSIVASDMCDKGDTLPIITGTTGITLGVGYVDYHGINFDAGGNFYAPGLGTRTFTICTIDVAGDFLIYNGHVICYDCTINLELTGSEFGTNTGGRAISIYGGDITGTSLTALFRNAMPGVCYFEGVDLAAMTFTNIVATPNAHGGYTRFVNCSMPATYGIFGTAPSTSFPWVELVGCNSSTGITSSIRDYEWEGYFGTIDSETTIVRTGGADDGDAGAYSLAMLTRASLTLEGSRANNLVSPRISAWVASGSQTLTVFVTHAGASEGDYDQDEMWCEFYYPSEAGGSDHDQKFDPDRDGQLFSSGTAVTDDASTWGGTNSNPQKFTITVAPDFAGWVTAYVHLARRDASPVALYVDPRIIVT